MNKKRFEKHADNLQKQIDIANSLESRTFIQKISWVIDEVKLLFATLDNDWLKSANKTEIRALIKAVHKLQDKAYGEATSKYLVNGLKVFTYSALHTAHFLARISTVKAKPAKAYKKALERPLYASGDSLKEHFKRLVIYEKQRLAKLVRQAWARNSKVDELTTSITGTKQKKHRDGYAHKAKQTAVATIDTATQHIQQDAKLQTMQESGIERYQIVATLDLRTTQICRDLDHKIYYVGEGILPPFHYNCRTTVVPVLDDDFSWLSAGRMRASKDGYVPDISYREWEKGWQRKELGL